MVSNYQVALDAANANQYGDEGMADRRSGHLNSGRWLHEPNPQILCGNVRHRCGMVCGMKMQHNQRCAACAATCANPLMRACAHTRAHPRAHMRTPVHPHIPHPAHCRAFVPHGMPHQYRTHARVYFSFLFFEGKKVVAS